tara:strand:- start:13100 stop:14179 length:1080 start_codon:yes stop_codon:yes gene_type:complete
MKIKIMYVAIFLISLVVQNATGQEKYENKVAQLKKLKTEITLQEKEALKIDIAEINKRLDNEQLTEIEAQVLKEEAARKRALNIENRLAIVENKILLLERNNGEVLVLESNDSIGHSRIGIRIDFKKGDGSSIKWQKQERWKKELQYDRKTYSDFVFAIGLNNALIDNQSLEDSPYKVGGSRFFEMGWQWRTRVFENSNFMRLNYGFSFQFNGLKPKDNQYFVNNAGQTELQEFEFDLDKSKLRMDNLVFPLHFEFGPSKLRKNDETIRYNIDRKFRVGIGGYGGFNLGSRQKLKYERDGENVKDKLKRGYNASNFIYGLSAYAGVGGTQLYVKYDLNPIFKDALVEQHNISLGLRFDL